MTKFYTYLEPTPPRLEITQLRPVRVAVTRLGPALWAGGKRRFEPGAFQARRPDDNARGTSSRLPGSPSAPGPSESTLNEPSVSSTMAATLPGSA